MKSIINTIYLIVLSFPLTLLGQAPTADFKANITRVCIGNTVTFADSTLNNPTSWSWSFPGGTPNSSNSPQPSITYNTPGTYNVTLTAANANGSDVATKTGYIRVILCRPSKGIYRIPYANNTDVRVSRDHLRHAPINNRIDMSGRNSNDPYVIVAAEDGVIRYIEENNLISAGACSGNNYVWIEHPNGEWTKYSHMLPGSSTAVGRFVGETVCAGTTLGIESDIGCASGDHLHFEVGVPDDISDPINESGGFLKGENFIPIICDISLNKFESGETYVANPCSSNCGDNIIIGMGDYDPPASIIVPVSGTITTPLGAGETIFNSGSTGVYRAGQQINLKPGFSAKSGSSFWATIKPCNSSPGLPSCNINIGF
jgi:PKD repeat protein